MTLNKYYSILVKLFITLMLIDFDGDFLLRQETGLFGSLQELIRYAIVVLLLLFGFLSFYNIVSVMKIKPIGQACLIIIFVTFGYGLLLGLLRNNPSGAIREFIAISPLCLIPIFLKMGQDKLFSIAKYLIYSLVFIIAVKILISQFVHGYTYGYQSWKILLRSSPLLLLPYIYFLASIVKGDIQKKNIFFLFVVMIEVFVAQSRGLNITLLLATLIVISTRQVDRRIFIPAIILPISALAVVIFTDIDFENVLGIWSGSHLESTVNHRMEQLDILVDRYISRPLTGFGFGYYTVGYLTYGELANSFSLELDLINFSTKIGLVFSSIYVFGYIIYILQYMKNRYHDQQKKIIDFSYLLALIFLLFYSLFQTFHSSIFYWLVYALSFSLILERSPPCQNSCRLVKI
jgi:hypothetical protein